jgi:tetratricopeptide (TPR) repeat protein
MNKAVSIVTLLILSLPGLAATTRAETADELLKIQHQWAQIQYDMPEKQREDAFAQLVSTIDEKLDKSNDQVQWLIWKGIVLSSQAGASGGLGGLKLAKQAREVFEQAIAIDPAALEGSALTSLATLYHEVPGWPIGFGDEEKAQTLFKQALEIAPDSMDNNYFYGRYLLDQGENKKGLEALQHALQAPARELRPRADRGRRQEIQSLIEQAG